MEYYNKIVKFLAGLVISALMLSCGPEPPKPINKTKVSQKEGWLAQDWQYATLLIDGDTFSIPEDNFEPIQWARNNDVKFRWYRYEGNGSYEFRWDGFGLNLILGDNMNYQPNFGFWRLSQNEDSVIHNIGFKYETSYKIIELTENSFIREYLRIIQEVREADTPDLVLGDTVVYREVFVPRVK